MEIYQNFQCNKKYNQYLRHSKETKKKYWPTINPRREESRHQIR